MNNYQLLEYNPKNLANVLQNDFVTVNKLTKEKFHYRFLLDYLGKNNPDALAAETIIVENNYVSRSYINDYSLYYSLCFSDNYTKKIKRVHFFNNSFSSSEFEEDIVNNCNNFINDETYLGYIVVKNLPSVVIGATLLKTYNNNSSRYYITRKSQVSLFGKKINFNSLVFQEQDKVVSACATTALWSAFYKTSSYFQTHLPSPSEITSSAKNSFNFAGRLFPNKEGLDHFQIGNAIENVGLVFELRNKENLKEPNFVKAFIYSYCKLGIPILLGIDIENKGRHLITISGFKYESKMLKKRNNVDVALISDELEMFYAHDDRIGPFSKLHIDNKENKKGIIETSWWIDETGNKKYRASVVSIVVPLHKKIRITFEDILNDVRHFDYFFKSVISKNHILKWDIYLSASNEYKNETIENSDLPDSFKKSVVFTHLPRYVWISRLLIDEYIVFELVFDSTDVSHGHFCLLMNCYDQGLIETIQTELKDNQFSNYIVSQLNHNYLDLLKLLNNETPTSGHK